MSLGTRRKKIWALLVVAVGLQWTGALAAPAPGGQRSPSLRWAHQLQRAVAHQRMKNTMYASTPSSPANGPMCPALVNLGRSRPVAVDLRGSFSVTDESLSDDDKAAALDFFLKHISGPVVQAKCVNCHVEGGVSGHTRLVFQPSSTPDHGATNLEAIRKLLSTVEDGAERILNKVQGVGHGGGVQVPAGSADFANMERLLALLGYGGGSGTDLTPETLFDTVTMASPGKTLRRAALIFGGKIPTREEREAVDNGTEEDLRTAIRGLMTGRGFHEFLIRASNDRLLTDRNLGGVIDYHGCCFVDYMNLHYEQVKASFERGYIDQWDDDPEWQRFYDNTQFGAGRAPLELIAHVVENDLPYTEILTADYIMANPMASEAYGASTRFDDEEDPWEFRPSEIVSYYRSDNSRVEEEHPDFGHRIVDPGNLSTDYPHAGILNTTVFLLRYPTTPTNRNRARSRWTYYHFLGLDIEKSASRTTDPIALADTDNPTLKNPACTVCHRVMDPVAGAFQNYGEDGEYRDEWGGLDSLDDFYKDPRRTGHTRPIKKAIPGTGTCASRASTDKSRPTRENSLQWLAERIVADDRFADATVKFWWPAILGVEIATPPEDENDSDFEAMLLASNSQSAEVARLADAFRTGIAGGKPYNLKDLLVEIVLSPWFRAELIKGDDPVRAVALRSAGAERLLTPEELDWKTQTITGYSWGRHYERVGTVSRLVGKYNDYGLAYGGIDSDAVTERADDMTAVMAAVAQSHAVEVSCPIVKRDFRLLPDEKRRLFGGIEENITPVLDEIASFEITSEDWTDPQTISFQAALDPGAKTIRLAFTNDFWDGEENDRNLYLDRMEVRSSRGKIVKQVEFESVLHEQECGTYWLNYKSYKFWSNCLSWGSRRIPDCR